MLCFGKGLALARLGPLMRSLVSWRIHGLVLGCLLWALGQHFKRCKILCSEVSRYKPNLVSLFLFSTFAVNTHKRTGTLLLFGCLPIGSPHQNAKEWLAQMRRIVCADFCLSNC